METLFSNTTTEQVDIAQLLGASTSAPITLGGFMGNTPDNTTMLGNIGASLQNPQQIAQSVETPAVETEQTDNSEPDISALLGKKEDEPKSEETTKTGGRPKSDKNALISYLNDKIAKEEFAVFGDYDDKVPVDEYLSALPEKRLYELFDKNIESVRSSVREELEKTQQETFYNSLPYELRQAYEYAANGGTNWTEFYGSIANAQHNYNLDPANEDHQEEIVRNYLEATTSMGPQRIHKQVEEWKNEGKIADKATEFKPDLDVVYQQHVEQLNRQQAEYQRQEMQRAQQYIQSVTETLKKGEIGGLKIDKKQQQELYRGLTMISEEWGNTNELEYHWNKINFQEPNPERIAEMLWFMKDRDGFLNAVRQQGANKQVENTFNELKRLSGKNNVGSNIVEMENTNKKPIKRLPTLANFLS